MIRHLPRITLVALLTAAWAGLGSAGGPVAGPSPSGPSDQEPPAEAGEPFVPKASVAGDRAIVNLTFPDGTVATISYTAALDLAGMGVQPEVDLDWEGHWVGGFVFTHGPPEQRLLAGAGPLTVHRIDGRPVEEWNAKPRGGRHQRTGRWLVFRLPDWTVHVP